MKGGRRPKTLSSPSVSLSTQTKGTNEARKNALGQLPEKWLQHARRDHEAIRNPHILLRTADGLCHGRQGRGDDGNIEGRDEGQTTQRYKRAPEVKAMLDRGLGVVLFGRSGGPTVALAFGLRLQSRVAVGGCHLARREWVFAVGQKDAEGTEPGGA